MLFAQSGGVIFGALKPSKWLMIFDDCKYCFLTIVEEKQGLIHFLGPCKFLGGPEHILCLHPDDQNDTMSCHVMPVQVPPAIPTIGTTTTPGQRGGVIFGAFKPSKWLMIFDDCKYCFLAIVEEKQGLVHFLGPCTFLGGPEHVLCLHPDDQNNTMSCHVMPCHAMSCHVQVPPAIPTPGTSSAAAIGATDISPAAPREPTPEGP